MTEPTRRTIVVIPVRALEGAKSRLGAALDAEERRTLVARLLIRTIEAALAAGVAEVRVVSPDPDVLGLAAARGAIPVAQRSQGLNRALEEARSGLGDDDRVLVLPGDLPAVSASAIEGLVALADEAGAPVVVLVTDRHGRGTNALLLDPASVIAFAFGGDSRDAHACLARDADARLIEPESALGIDLDTPDDLLLAEELAPDLVR